jgi:glucokinase
MILAGDIGGTNTRLAFFENGKIAGEEKKYPSHKYNSLEEIIWEFLNGKKVDRACFGVAGPVREGKSKITNLSWVIDAEHIRQKIKIPVVHLLNDLEANAYGLKALQKNELFLLHEGKPQKGNQALIAAGTGLGEAGLFWDGKKHQPFACEGGHTDFAPRNAKEIELFVYLQKQFGHVSYERVISGPGLENLFRFLIETGREKWDPKLKEEMKKRDPARVISDWGKEGKDRACVHTLEWFLSLYGAEAGNMALKFLSLGGFYVGGGIAPHLIDQMKKGGFHSAFIDKGRFRELLDSIPIWIVLNDNAALLGAGNYTPLDAL